ncbi:MAG TPA: methyltransferase domain-containing protein [Candidatus Limnocylindrales bacterium]|nr:methyltransferase domain-containing protein [Candidatus Limnocylindrales bacterium]
MPESCCGSCYDSAFDGRLAERELREYRRRGPGRASRAIAEALARTGVEGRTVLDIGGGVGAVHQQLLARGAARVTDVDASRPYLEAARSEAERLDLADRVRFEYGDFVTLAPGIEAADLVALDRVVCCYGDVDALVGLAAARTRRRLAITMPPDAWPVRAVFALGNAWYRLTRNAYRAYAHPQARVVAAARGAGLEPAGPPTSVGLWRLLVFERPILTADSR